jgi:hypothetical protein
VQAQYKLCTNDLFTNSKSAHIAFYLIEVKVKEIEFLKKNLLFVAKFPMFRSIDITARYFQRSLLGKLPREL